MKTTFAAVLGLTIIFASASADAALIDFNAAVGTPHGYVEQGVTFSYLGTGSNFFSISPNTTQAITMSGGDIDGQMRADFGGGASSVSIDLGDFDVDADRLILQIWSAGNALLGTQTIDIAAPFTGMVTLALANPNIAYATFGTTGDLGLGGIYADNLTWTPVPEPGTLLLLSAGLAAVGYRRRRSS